MNVRCVTIAVSVVAWTGILVLATYHSDTPVVFGQYSWGQVTLLSLLLYTAVMAEYLSKNMVSYWIMTSSRPLMASPREETRSRVRSRVIELTAFVRGWPGPFRKGSHT
jgi:hypothetical protein